MWDYGALGEDEEREYIKAKLDLVQKSLPLLLIEENCASLTELIVESQKVMRNFVFHFLCSIHDDPNQNLAELASKSCVSQRDIQRVITFYIWLIKVYSKFSPYCLFEENQTEYQRRAMLVSLGIVYFLRLPDNYREHYAKIVNEMCMFWKVKFSEAFNDDLEWITKQIFIPKGIALTQTLKENLFAMIACMCTRTPLLIVGEPGSSKTLSFHLTTESLRGRESISDVLKNTDVFPSTDPYFYQCSLSTTSNDIVVVFERAIRRQETLVHSVEKKNCVVFMDEAGLPEESRESLKALHYYLDKPSVSFIAISNHVLDAAKSNRCVSVVRMKVSIKELESLAKGCLCDTPDNVPLESKREINTIVKFCSQYDQIICKKFKNFFGLRDFVHFLTYLRRHRGRLPLAKLVLQALERNFNGSASFPDLVSELMSAVIEVHMQEVLLLLELTKSTFICT